MFQTTMTEVLQRLRDVDSHFRAVCPSDSSGGAAISKGLLFVELYAVYEYAVQSAVQCGINAINQLSLPPVALRAELLSIGLDQELTAMHDSERTKNKWDRRIRFFSRLVDATPVVAQDNTMPNPGTGNYYKPAHIETIWTVFGIATPIVPENRCLGYIDEFIEFRHGIAHGRLTAGEVGRRFSITDMRTRITNTQSICLHILQVMEQHCVQATNLCRPS